MLWRVPLHSLTAYSPSDLFYSASADGNLQAEALVGLRIGRPPPSCWPLSSQISSFAGVAWFSYLVSYGLEPRISKSSCACLVPLILTPPICYNLRLSHCSCKCWPKFSLWPTHRMGFGHGVLECPVLFHDSQCTRSIASMQFVLSPPLVRGLLKLQLR